MSENEQQKDITFLDLDPCEYDADQLDDYVDTKYGNILTPHDIKLFKILLLDRWYKGSRKEIKDILKVSDPMEHIKHVYNAVYDRKINKYKHGDKLSAPRTSKMIRDDLDFETPSDLITKYKSEAIESTRGWNDDTIEQLLASFSSISGIIKNKSEGKFIFLELMPSKREELKQCFLNAGWSIILNKFAFNVNLCAISMEKPLFHYMRQLTPLLKDKYVIYLFCTDLDAFFKPNQSGLTCDCSNESNNNRSCKDIVINLPISEIDDNSIVSHDSDTPTVSKESHNESQQNVNSVKRQDKSNNTNKGYPFYLYNFLKFRYYCLCDKLIFLGSDYHIIYLLYTIALIEWSNKCRMSSLTLEEPIQDVAQNSSIKFL